MKRRSRRKRPIRTYSVSRHRVNRWCRPRVDHRQAAISNAEDYILALLNVPLPDEIRDFTGRDRREICEGIFLHRICNPS